MNRAALLVLLCGCRQLFGIDTPVAGDGGTHRDASDDAQGQGHPDVLCTGHPAQLVADTVIASSVPQQNYGTSTILETSEVVGVRALLAFDITGFVDVSSWTGFDLVLPYAAHDIACGGATGCNSCATTDQTGGVHFFALRTDWTEGGASWKGPAMNVLWGAAGASGMTDISGELARADHTVGSDSTLVGDAQAIATLASWIGVVNNRTIAAFEVRSEQTLTVRSKEATCDPGAPAATLMIYACPP